MKKLFFALLCCFYSHYLVADEFQFGFKTTGSIKGLHDVSLIDLKFTNSFESIYADESISGFLGPYTGIEFEVLSSWTQNEFSTVSISYAPDKGAQVTDILTGASFSLIGESTEKLIELSRQVCLLKGFPSYHCSQMAQDSWLEEVDRSYIRHGGETNLLLKASQDAWLEFFNSEKALLSKHYSSKEGSFWEIEYVARVSELLKQRVLHLDSLLIW